MDRKKPSLTSPWKVGFLVALLLVVTSLGVSYFITGTFGVTWHWIHIGGLHPSTWAFNPGAFIEEMAPLIVLTLLLAFASYVLVAGAVRRYKAYVDSGAEYKQLLKSIKSIEDLEDVALTDRLKQHPELREFLMGLRHRVAALERNNGGRERKQGHDEAQPARDERPRLASESALLASAIANGRDAFTRELALTVPELKQVERSLREHFRDAATSAPADASAPADSGELDALRSAVLGPARAIRRDVEACGTGARELETALAQLCTALEDGPPAPAQNTDAVQKRIDMTAEAIAALGEETRRIAIASALQASGGPEADTIKVADELRTLATRFNTVAQHWRETAPALKQMIGAGSRPRRSPGAVADAAANAMSRARLWSERLIAMNENVRVLERAVNGAAAPAPESAPETPRAAAPADLADEAVAAPAPEPVFTSNATEDFVTRGNADLLASDDDTVVAFADIPGFEKERKFFADAPANEQPDDRFVVDRADEGRWDLSDDGDESAQAQATPAAPASGHDSDGFLTGPRPAISPKKIERVPRRPAAVAPEAPRTTAPAPAPEPVAATATLDPDADAIDLYELGAVDCVQTV